MEPNLKKQRTEASQAALLRKYQLLCEDGFFMFQSFTSERYSVIVRVQKVMDDDNVYLHAEITNRLQLFKAPWIHNAYGFKDFEHMMTQIVNRLNDIKRCLHCIQLSANLICETCQDFLLAPIYTTCIGCATEEHPISWMCLTCIDSRYCSMCAATLISVSRKPVIKCPTCKQVNQSITEPNMYMCVTSDEQLLDSSQLPPLERVQYYLTFRFQTALQPVTVDSEALRELSDCKMEEIEHIVLKLRARGYGVIFKAEMPWSMIVSHSNTHLPREESSDDDDDL
jgi:phage FluMu protein Com